MFSLIGGLVGNSIKKVEDFVEDPVGTSVDIATKPIRDGLNIIDGLTEGEIRLKAIASLGADAVGDMALDELIEWYKS